MVDTKTMVLRNCVIGSHFLLAEKKRKRGNLWYLLKVSAWPDLYSETTLRVSITVLFKQKMRILDKNNGFEEVFLTFFTNFLNFGQNTVRWCKITNV